MQREYYSNGCGMNKLYRADVGISYCNLIFKRAGKYLFYIYIGFPYENCQRNCYLFNENMALIKNASNNIWMEMRKLF